MFRGYREKGWAYLKYGENHAKLAELLDLVVISNTRPRRVYLTSLGKMYFKADDKEKIEIIKTQIYRMYLVRYIIMNYKNIKFNLYNDLKKSLKNSTIDRRMSNIKSLFKFLRDNGIGETEDILATLEKVSDL